MEDGGVWQQRVVTLEQGLKEMNDTMIRHLATCEELAKQSVQYRADMRDTVGKVLDKIDILMTINIEQRGAIKYGKTLYAIIGAAGALGAWAVSHITFMK